MSFPDYDVGHSEWFFPFHLHWLPACKFEPTPQTVWAVATTMWRELGEWESWVRVTTGKTLPVPWGWMGHVWLGEDLSRVERPDGQKVAGYAGGDLRYQPPVQDWAVGCWVDDTFCRTAKQLGMMAAHEAEHLLGRLPSHPPFPVEQRAAGAQAAVRRSRGWNSPLPNKVVTPPGDAVPVSVRRTIAQAVRRLEREHGPVSRRPVRPRRGTDKTARGQQQRGGGCSCPYPF